MILYINNEHCSSVEQLKGYFKDEPTSISGVYADLLDCGRYGDIADWLREMDEPEMAGRVESISIDLNDSAFYAQLKVAIIGFDAKDVELQKPAFDKCFAFEGVKCYVKDHEAKVSVSLKILMSINETYELCVFCNWGMRGIKVSPYDYTIGKTVTIDFTLRKSSYKEIGEIVVMADGNELFHKNIPTARGYNQEIMIGDVKIKMIHVAGGTFTMGETPEMNSLFSSCVPEHQVTLSSYSIGETPVTQALWRAVMDNNPSCFIGDNKPVESVTWDDCQEFIKKLNEKTGMEFRLPTEAEWEFAARGGNKSKHYQYSGSDYLHEVGWDTNNSDGETHPVKTKKANELGLYDMSGNVNEWCQDWYSEYTREAQTNPTGPINGNVYGHVYRGGSWASYVFLCHSSYRSYDNSSSSYIGFRLALSE